MRDLACNVGGWDRDARLAIGLAAGALALLGGVRGPARAAAGAVSAVALGTALSGYCPMNRLLGIDTCNGFGLPDGR